jgi:hypothetical protein
MEKNDGEFKNKAHEIAELGKKIDELRTAALKGHAVVEGMLDAFIEASVFHPQHVKLQYTNFHVKGSVGQALCLNEDNEPHWDVLWALNQLRNKIAHNESQKVIDEKLKALRAAYLKTLTGEEAEEAKKFSETKMIEQASWDCGGFLAMSAMHAKSRRTLIEENWAP